jgi:hypothetical protein
MKYKTHINLLLGWTMLSIEKEREYFKNTHETLEEPIIRLHKNTVQ